MINLAAAAVLVRDLTEQHLEGASAPAGRNREAPPNGNAPAAARHPGPARRAGIRPRPPSPARVAHAVACRARPDRRDAHGPAL
jgi:hypothetical protein